MTIKKRKDKDRNGVPFKRKFFEKALARRSYTKTQLAKMLFPKNIDPLRRLQKYQETEEIPPKVLDEIAEILDISPDYLKGVNLERKADLEKEFASEFDEYFTEKDFDEDGYYLRTYYDYRSDKKQMSVDEMLIQYLNHDLYAVYRDPSAKISHRFDFHNLDRSTLITLQGMIKEVVERQLLNPKGEWKKFVNNSLSKSTKESIKETRQRWKKYVADHPDWVHDLDEDETDIDD